MEEVICKSSYPLVPHWYPEEKTIFFSGNKYKVANRKEKTITIVGEDGDTFTFGLELTPERPVFEKYFYTRKELRKLKLEKLNGKSV